MKDSAGRTSADIVPGEDERPDIYDRARIEQDIAALEAGTGSSYFEIIREIIADHPNIALCEA